MNWIECDTKLPSDKEIVLAVSVNGGIHYCKYENDQFYRHTELSDNDRIISYYWNDIVRWMPLPSLAPTSQGEEAADWGAALDEASKHVLANSTQKDDGVVGWQYCILGYLQQHFTITKKR